MLNTWRDPVCDGAILLGDAGLHVDPLFGQGHSFALISAEIFGELAPSWLEASSGTAVARDTMSEFTRRRDAALMPYYNASLKVSQHLGLDRGSLLAHLAANREAVGGRRDGAVRADGERRKALSIVSIRAADGAQRRGVACIVETHLGRFPAQAEVPEPLKFAWPIVVLPELFTTPRHLATLVGYLTSIGWEVYAPDLYAVLGHGETTPLEKIDFAKLTDLAAEAIAALGREAIVVGHGIGGLVALKLAERSGIKASVAIAPLAPGFRTPLFMPKWNFFSSWQQRPLNPPTRRMLFEFVADADVHSREQIIKALMPGPTAAALEVANGKIDFVSIRKNCAAPDRRGRVGYFRAV